MFITNLNRRKEEGVWKAVKRSARKPAPHCFNDENVTCMKELLQIAIE